MAQDTLEQVMDRLIAAGLSDDEINEAIGLWQAEQTPVKPASEADLMKDAFSQRMNPDIHGRFTLGQAAVIPAGVAAAYAAPLVAPPIAKAIGGAALSTAGTYALGQAAQAMGVPSAVVGAVSLLLRRGRK